MGSIIPDALAQINERYFTTLTCSFSIDRFHNEVGSSTVKNYLCA